MIQSDQLRANIIRPSLQSAGLWSVNAEELLLFTCAAETLGGSYVQQLGGPAAGIYQMEPNTYDDCWKNVIEKDGDLFFRLIRGCNFSNRPIFDDMVLNLKYATLMCRIQYLRFPESIPIATDIEAIYKYYKKYWNSVLGSSTEKGSMDSYYKVLGIKEVKNGKKKSSV